jgi:diguanylate cyclase (GGDEF)-like protein
MTRHDRLEDEEGRLAALRRYEILDTAEEAPFQRIAELVQVVLGVPVAAVTVIDAERQWQKCILGLERQSIPRENTVCNETIRCGEAVMVPDLTVDGRFAALPSVVDEPHLRSYLGVPLTSPDGYHVGTLCALDTIPRHFDARETVILTRLAELVIEQFELRQIAKQDPLTGALSRRGFYAEVEREFLRATRYDRPSALMTLDIDSFRAINDRYGHAAGDAVLIAIAGACMATMRKSDVFGRVGGGEFGLLLPETSAEEARDAAERVRQIIEKLIVEAPAGPLRVTVSVGVAPLPAAAEGVGVWHSEADIALYEAKQFGRNRVVAGRPRRPAPLATDEDHQRRRPH